MRAPYRLLMNCVRTLVLFFVCNVGLYWLIVGIWENREFAALIAGLGALPIIVGMCSGFVRHWRTRRDAVIGEVREASRVAKHAAVCGWASVAATIVFLAILQPSGWAPWAFALPWGVLGGGSFAVAFKTIQRDLDLIEEAEADSA